MVEPEYPLTLVARHAQLSPQLIRAWEARHRAVTPRRAPNGRRLYTQADLARLQTLRRLTAAGFPISRIAHLSSADLEALATRELPDLLPLPSHAGVAASGTAPAAFVADAMLAIGRLDGDAFLRSLETAEIALGKSAFLEQVVAELADEVGVAWRAGKLKVAHEHFATAQLRGYLGPFGRVPHLNATTPHLIVTTPRDQWHELGALLVAAAAHSHGWRVSYLGPSLPVEEIAGAAIGYRARAVALSIVYPEDDAQLPRELVRLRHLLPASTALLIGGRGSPAYRACFEDCRARHLPALHDLYPVLDELRRGPEAMPSPVPE